MRHRSKSGIEDVFRPQEERFAARLATSGLSGSGVAADQWANEIMKGQNRMLKDLLTEIEHENLNLTRADQAQALSMFPALNPLNNLFTYKGLLFQDEAMRSKRSNKRRWQRGRQRPRNLRDSEFPRLVSWGHTRHNFLGGDMNEPRYIVRRGHRLLPRISEDAPGKRAKRNGTVSFRKT